MPRLTRRQRASRGAMLQRMADAYDKDVHTAICPCCKRPYETGAERLARFMSDPAKLRIINALAALE